MRRRIIPALTLFAALAWNALAANAQQPAETPPSSAESFAPLQAWRQAVLAGDRAALAQLYAVPRSVPNTILDPAARKLLEDLDTWADWKRKGLTSLTLLKQRLEVPSPDIRQLFFEADLAFDADPGPHTQHVALAQSWVLGKDGWQIAVADWRSLYVAGRPPASPQPSSSGDKVLYPPDANASAEIAAALQSASATNKNVLLAFGANWCHGCHVLDDKLRSPEVAPLLDSSFLVVHVDVGELDKNLDIAKKYAIPLDRGVPAVAILAPNGTSGGKLIFSQRHGQFVSALFLTPKDLLEFLNKWKPSTTKD